MQHLIQGFEQLRNLNKEFGMDNELTEGILRDLHQFRAIVPILGRFGSEKDMLINVLLRGKNNFLNEGSFFESSLPVEICYGNAAKVQMIGGTNRVLDPQAFFNGKEDIFGADAIRITLDIPILQKIPDVTLVNIPEFEPEFASISRIQKEYITRSLACILLFPADDMEPESGELNLIKLFKSAGVPVHILISKTESLSETFLMEKIETLRLALAKPTHGMEVSFSAPATIPDQFSEFIDYLLKIQANIHALSQNKYATILIKQLELIQLYIKTRISNRSLSLLALDSRDVDMNNKIEQIISTVKTTDMPAETLPEDIEEIKADAKKMIHSDESTFVKMLLNYREISEKTKSSMKVDVSPLNTIITVDLPALLKKSGPKNAYDLLSNFKAEFSKFKDFILYDKLIGKHVVGLGGASASGKTSFLNSLLGSDILPADKEPFKSLSTYVIEGDTYKVQGVNIFDAKIDMEGSLGSEICASEEEAKELKRILNNLFVFTPRQKYKHIAFLDMPSYEQLADPASLGRDMDHCDRHQLNSSDFLIWCIHSTADTISDADVQYLQTIRKDIPKLFVVTHAKDKSAKELNSILYKIKMDLDMHGIDHLGVFAYESEKPYAYGSREIFAQLEKWNDVKYEDMGFARRFKALFVKSREYYETEINNSNKQLNSITKALNLSENNYVREYLTHSAMDLQNKKDDLSRISDSMKDLQTKFFKQIKAVSDIVGIAMPVPSEIDLIQEPMKDPMQLLKECRTKLRILRKIDYTDIFSFCFSHIQPVLNQCKGGSAYQSELTITLLDSYKIQANRIKFNTIYTETEEYKKMIDSQEIGNWGEEKIMEAQSNNVDAMRIYFKRLIGRKYPIPEHPLRLMDDYNKELYMKMLCVIMLYDNEPTEAQTMYIQRLLSGISVKEYVNEYIKKAMKADVDFAGEFIHLLTGTQLAHNFVVDSLILVSIEGEPKQSQLDFISELCEMLSISRTVMEYLASLAVSILEQDGTKYQQSLSKLPPEVDNNRFFGYIKSFFSGCLLNTPDEIYYYSKTKKAIPFLHDNLTIYGVRKIRLENIIIDLNEVNPYFESFDSLELIQCDFINGKKSVRLGDGNSLIIEKCNFKGFRGFKAPMFALDAVMREIIVDNCDFTECSVDANWMEGLGSIFSLNGRLNSFSVQNSRFTKCTLRNVRNFHDSGAIGCIRAEAVSLLNNTFTACRCDTGRLFYVSSGKILEENNRTLGLPKLNYY